ncbi:hypothetical protein [Lentzea sp. NPDC004782]|uniref:hypothetical protein n=1 Tax=Lentzea sp. NPDC004782 TaxID=3154458 RepID=UPI0033A46F0E
MTPSELDARRAEQWFRRRGLPAVVRGLERNLAVRVVPAVTWLGLSDLLYVVLTVADGDSEFGSRLENALFLLFYTAVLVGSVVLPLVGAWFAANWARDRALDDRGFGPASAVIGAYVVLWPVGESLLEGPFRWSGLVASVFASLVIVGLLLALTAVGMGSVFGWALRAAVRQLRSVGTMTSRSMPLLLLVTVFGFYTAEIWQSAGQIPRDRIWLVLGFFAVLSGLFLRSVFAAELRALITGWRDRLPALPADTFGDAGDSVHGSAPPFTRLERANLFLILLLTQLLQALVFAMIVFVAFVVLGELTVPDSAIKSWVGHDPNQGVLFGVQVPLSNDLVQVCLFIAAFSTLYFIATIVTDAAHRKTFFDPVLEHLQVSLAGRAVYLARFGPRSAAPPAARRGG